MRLSEALFRLFKPVGEAKDREITERAKRMAAEADREARVIIGELDKAVDEAVKRKARGHG